MSKATDCQGCGTQLPPRSGPGRPQKWCAGCKDAQRKRMRRAELAPVPTLWAAEEKAERDAWRRLGRPADPDRRLFRARLVSGYDVDPEVLAVFIEESQGRIHRERRPLRTEAAA